MTLKFVSIPAKRLAQSILSTDMSFTLNNIEGWDGEDLVAGDFGTDLYVAFMNSTKTVVEFMKIDPATIASASITISKRGLQYDGDLSTEVTANKQDWTAGDTFVMLGTDTPQMFQWLKEYIDSVAIAGTVNATTSLNGVVELATQAEVDAGTATGGTGAPIVATPATTRGKKTNDYIADAGSSDAYAITVVPAITAYAEGQIFTFKANTENTGACTLNVCALGAITIKKAGKQTFGDNTTQFDITNPSGTTFRYTWDSTGTNPGISATTIPIGTKLYIQGQNFVAGNKGTFVVTGSGSNYFEITNASGVAESDKTIGTGYIQSNFVDLVTGDILAEQIVMVQYDKTGNFQLLSRAQQTTPVVRTYTTVSTEIGGSTTQFDITNPSGTTFRYTYDSTGTDPSLSAANNPIGSLINFQAENFTAANNGLFVVTGSGSNYVEVTNASGVAESNKTIGTGYIQKSGTTVWTKPAGLKYVTVELVGGGAGGGSTTSDGQVAGGGGAGAYSKKTISESSLNSSEYYIVGKGGAAALPGRISAFGTHFYATGGLAGGSAAGSGGSGFNGDINIPGSPGTIGWGSASAPSISLSGEGGDSFFGGGGTNVQTGDGGAATGYGSGGGGSGSQASAQTGGAGYQGIIILTEYYG